MIQIPLEIGDTILVGRFKNKKITVKEISYDEYGSPTVNGISILKIRIPKLYQTQENKMNEMSYNKAMKFANSGKTTKSNFHGYALGPDERRGSPTLSKAFIDSMNEFPTEVEQYQYLIDYLKRYDLETEKQLKKNPNLKIIGQRPDFNKLQQKQKNSMKLQESIERFSKQTNVKIKQENNRWHIYLETVDGDECLTPVGYETKEQAEHAAMMKGYNFKGNPYSEDYEGLEVEKPSKREVTKGTDKPEEMKLDKEKKIKLESMIRRAIREISKKPIKLKEELSESELEQKARRFAELAQKMKAMESELKQMELEYTNLDQELTPLVEQVGKTKDTFIRAGKLLIKIEREGYERKSSSYKTGFEYLYKKVNATMKDLADEALKMTETVSYVKSKISVVQGESNLKEENWFQKIKNFLGSKIKKLFGLNNQANQLLTQLESKI